MKQALRDRIRPVDIVSAIEKMGLEIRTILLDHPLVSCGRWPQYPEHRDPFDRLLIAQACSHNLTIITRDRRFSLYRSLALIEY